MSSLESASQRCDVNGSRLDQFPAPTPAAMCSSPCKRRPEMIYRILHGMIHTRDGPDPIIGLATCGSNRKGLACLSYHCAQRCHVNMTTMMICISRSMFIDFKVISVPLFSVLSIPIARVCDHRINSGPVRPAQGR